MLKTKKKLSELDKTLRKLVGDNKLPVVFKRNWIKALKSGKYKQGKSYLFDRDKNTYCCLGVAAVVCEIGKKHINENNWLRLEKHKRVPKNLSTNGELQAELAKINDNGKHSFKQIADLIKKNL